MIKYPSPHLFPHPAIALIGILTPHNAPSQILPCAAPPVKCTYRSPDPVRTLGAQSVESPDDSEPARGYSGERENIGTSREVVGLLELVAIFTFLIL